MEVFTTDTFRGLFDHTGNPGQILISLFMPTVSAGDQTRQNPIRFRNLLNQVREQLIQTGMRAPDADTLLQPAMAYEENHGFWQHQGEGLALFMGPDRFELHRLPYPVEEKTAIGERFIVTPLIPLMGSDRRFYILTLSQQDIHLYEASRYQIEELNLGDTPTNVQDALQYDDVDFQSLHHMGSPGGIGETTIMHGQRSNDNPRKQNIIQFFHQVDAGVKNIISGDNAPLILYGVEYLLPLYREANTYPYLHEQGLEGNPKLLSPQALQAEAWPLIAPALDEAKNWAVTLYKQSAPHTRATQLKDILLAAHGGRVDTLFIREGADHPQGAYHVENNTLDTNSSNGHTQDLYDLAAAHTLSNSGVVYVLPSEEMPEPDPIVALFRY